MPGFSLTLLLLPRQGQAYSPDEILDYLDAPADVPGWRWYSKSAPMEIKTAEDEVEKVVEESALMSRESLTEEYGKDHILTLRRGSMQPSLKKGSSKHSSGLVIA
jgi:hypothetical protein